MASFVVNQRGIDEFGIKIEFERNTPAPSRVFRAMSAFIESYEVIDTGLLSSVTTRIQPLLLLEDIEAGSVRTWLRNTLESFDDEALKSGDYKKLIGAYLVKAKRILINFMDEKTTIESPGDLTALQRQLVAAAEESDALRIATYQPIPTSVIAEALKALGDASTPLLASDAASYLSSAGESRINMAFSVAPQQIEDLLVREQLMNDVGMILRVKKPDFIGESMWDFVHDGRTLSARIGDTEWLETFRNGQVPLNPGDSLRAIVRSTVRYGFDNEVVAARYDILKVTGVLRKERLLQIPLEER